MEVSYLDRAEEDLGAFDVKVEEEIREKIDELRQKGTGHEDVKLIRVEGRPVFRIEIGERNQTVDHRAVFDIVNAEILVLAVIHRDEGYNVLSF